MSEGSLFLVALATAAWVWHGERKAHERVTGIGKRVCRDLDLQLLDDTVVLRRLRLSWRRHGLELRRVYRFDFSADGQVRNSGEIALQGLRLDWVRIQHPDGDYFVDIS